MEKEISDSEKVTILYENDEVLYIHGTYTMDGIRIEFDTNVNDDYKSCHVYSEETATAKNINCNDAYAYLVQNSPNLAKELETINSDLGLNSDAFTDGDKEKVEEVIKNF